MFIVCHIIYIMSHIMCLKFNESSYDLTHGWFYESPYKMLEAISSNQFGRKNLSFV